MQNMNLIIFFISISIVILAIQNFRLYLKIVKLKEFIAEQTEYDERNKECVKAMGECIENISYVLEVLVDDWEN